ncbi:MAG: zinc-binding alcohol dehydrogenase family protein [Rhizobiaceae bacterium]|nr:MAG: zinc-binding alcohol dehydrogenase family protein [Rhizobiaceae bacterium]
MKAIRLDRFDGPDGLEVVTLPKPQPGAGEVLVRVRASGVNFFETLMLRDRYAVTPALPMVPGVEVAGEIEAVGVGVGFPGVGARVAVPLFAIGRGSGGYAEYITVDAASVVPLPDGLPFDTAVALMVQGLTAVHLVRQSQPKGKSVLVNAAAGGVGSLLAQLAKDAGARRVIAAASTPEKLRCARSLGADVGVDYSRADWPDHVIEASGGVGADVIYEMIGGTQTKASLAALAPGGEMIFGAMGRFALVPADMERMFQKNQSIRGFSLLPLLSQPDFRADLCHLFERAASGGLKLLPGSHYPLEQAAEAHSALENRRTIGKVVLKP